MVDADRETANRSSDPVPPTMHGYPKFGLSTMLLVMVVFSVMGAAGHYLMVAMRSGTSPKAVFIIFTLAAPMLLLTALSLMRAVVRWLSRR